MYPINLIADYTIFRFKSEGAEASSFNNLKLQKILYYIQAWNLTFKGVPLFVGRFEAWIHGPVNREVFNRFKLTKSIYSEMDINDLTTQDFNSISEDDRAFIDNVIETYGKFSGTQLESMTHNEEPWMKARAGYRPTQSCSVEMDEQIMISYYSKRLKS